MRKLLISLVVIAALGAGGAFAQSGSWAGVSGGWPGVQAHFGVENVFAGLDVRGNIGYFYGGNYFELGASVIYGLDVDVGAVPLDVYVGGGPGIGYRFASGGSESSNGNGNGNGEDNGNGSDEVASGFHSALEAFAGAEYRLEAIGLEQGGVFLELGPKLIFTPDFGFAVLARLGFNWHF